jgi:hypothetical protein
VIVGKAAGAEDRCPPSCVRVKNEWSIPLVPLYAFMAWSVKWLDCKTVVQFPAVVLVSVAISAGLRRIERAAEHSGVVSRLGMVASFSYTPTRIIIVYGEQAELHL